MLGARTHSTWFASSVFDGARVFEGVMPDLDLHCARVNASAEVMHLDPAVSVETWMGLTADGVKRFDKDTALYIRPMYWAEHNGPIAGRARSGVDALVPHALRGADAYAGRLRHHAVALP